MRFFIVAILALAASALPPRHAAGAPASYAVARLPTPMFNIPDFPRIFGGSDGATLETDRCGQIRQLEFVALPGTVFRIEGSVADAPVPVYRVTTEDYPYPSRTGYFIDGRLVNLTSEKPQQRQRNLPPRREVIDRLLQAQGSIYVWGGNIRSGIPELRELYSPKKPTAPETTARWELRGVDCSGLLYEATDGYTPRNTSALLHFGSGVPIAGRSDEEIMRAVKPLDLIVWDGHVLIILDRNRVIESYLDCSGEGGGVRVRPLRNVLEGLRPKREALDAWPTGGGKGTKGFVIRRWHEGQ
ncbi:C40 family peptidase [Geobacter sp. DSM 9736]|uniref:C40 family peptidase n=1 Tax=Geobacter sp. DSM 9736 TaxID=1277350 RepID=UPI000B50FDAB|nr:C40 family peptidase [Geobacter sp. DSM 9736]SNB46866.1 Cell wall-associated hydrolase, NlpC family [Geobacter sp. DSM 9736]